jgi:DNA-binding MarR family transcriptional regulator
MYKCGREPDAVYTVWVSTAKKYVNMADVNSDQMAREPATDMTDPTIEGAAAVSRQELELIELLFFAYRDFIAGPDAILSHYEFGRAHHRVLHFVSRHPGIRVADLLDILKITKQSLGRVLKQLIDSDFIRQMPGPRDRRQRLLYTTEKGTALANRLTAVQADKVHAALAGLSPEAQAGAASFLRHMIDDSERAAVARLVGR